MPTFEVRRTRPVLWFSVVEALDPKEALDIARDLWLQETMIAAEYATVARQPLTADDSGDARSEARYEQTDTDAETERRADHRWGLGATESPAEGTEA